MTAFEDFVNTELPLRSALLQDNGRPNESADAAVNGAPAGTWYLELDAPGSTPRRWYKIGSGSTAWRLADAPDRFVDRAPGGFFEVGFLDVFVDASTGSDVEGNDGLDASTPLATIEEALARTEVYAKPVRINLAAGSYAPTAANFVLQIETRDVHFKGATTLVETVFVSGGSHVFTRSSGTWTVDEHEGRFLADAANLDDASAVVPILKNTATQIIAPGGLSGGTLYIHELDATLDFFAAVPFVERCKVLLERVRVVGVLLFFTSSRVTFRASKLEAACSFEGAAPELLLDGVFATAPSSPFVLDTLDRGSVVISSAAFRDLGSIVDAISGGPNISFLLEDVGAKNVRNVIGASTGAVITFDRTRVYADGLAKVSAFGLASDVTIRSSLGAQFTGGTSTTDAIPVRVPVGSECLFSNEAAWNLGDIGFGNGTTPETVDPLAVLTEFGGAFYPRSGGRFFNSSDSLDEGTARPRANRVYPTRTASLAVGTHVLDSFDDGEANGCVWEISVVEDTGSPRAKVATMMATWGTSVAFSLINEVDDGAFAGEVVFDVIRSAGTVSLRTTVVGAASWFFHIIRRAV